jgi:hypothetical protein
LLELPPLNFKSHTFYLKSLEAPDWLSMHLDSLHQILSWNIFFDHLTFACLITAHYIISSICGNLHAYVWTAMNNDDGHLNTAVSAVHCPVLQSISFLLLKWSYQTWPYLLLSVLSRFGRSIVNQA